MLFFRLAAGRRSLNVPGTPGRRSSFPVRTVQLEIYTVNKTTVFTVLTD